MEEEVEEEVEEEAEEEEVAEAAGRSPAASVRASIRQQRSPPLPTTASQSARGQGRRSGRTRCPTPPRRAQRAPRWRTRGA